MADNTQDVKHPPPPVNLMLYRLREKLRLLREKAELVASLNRDTAK